MRNFLAEQPLRSGEAREQTCCPSVASNDSDVERPSRILVVDDVTANREILRRRLIRRGFDVIEACGGLEALEIVRRESIDILLLDIMMPDLNGIEVLREIRRTHSPTDLPIIMVSAKSLCEDVSQCLEAGANDYITKPVDFALMLARIAVLLEDHLSHGVIKD